MTNQTRQILRVDGISKEAKEDLKKSALQLFGSENVSELIRKLIVEHLAKNKNMGFEKIGFNANEKNKRVEIRLPISIVSELEKRAEARFSDRNYYIKSMIYAALDAPQLQSDEIETLRRSNYELSKIGGNINQIAKAFNTLVSARSFEKMPELGKKIASLRKDINSHTSKVLAVLETKTKMFGAKGRLKAAKSSARKR